MIATMNHSILLMLMLVLVHLVAGNTFIWDPTSSGNADSWKRPYHTFTNTAICVNIPANLSLCHGIKYNRMRLPNLLHHDTLNEVIEQSESWIQLTKINCHPDTQLFLCSLFTPVCLDQTIPPCRSLCESVKTGCEPFMLKHGYTWPSIMQCQQFPVDNNMCIQSQANKPETTTTTTITIPVTTSRLSKHRPNNKHDKMDKTVSNENENNLSVEDEKYYNQLLDAICRSDWVIKSSVNQIRNSQVRVKKFRIIYGNFSQKNSFSLPVNRTQVLTATEGPKRKSKYILIGNGEQNPGLALRLMVSWNRNTAQIKKALRNAKSGNGCVKAKLVVTRSGANRRRLVKRKRNRIQPTTMAPH